jgi:hypothetical protein
MKNLLFLLLLCIISCKKDDFAPCGTCLITSVEPATNTSYKYNYTFLGNETQFGRAQAHSYSNNVYQLNVELLMPFSHLDSITY